MARTHLVPTTATLIVCLVGLVSTTSEAQGTTSPAAAISVPRPGMVRNMFPGPPSVLKRSQFTLTDERLAADAAGGAADAQAWRSPFSLITVESSSLAQRRGYRGGGRGRRNGAVAAMVIGAAASIAGTAVLVYANRPECGTNQMASGCGYGTKVVGGAVLSAGIVGFVVGAFAWR